jgi:hypothetical protein
VGLANGYGERMTRVITRGSGKLGICTLETGVVGEVVLRECLLTRPATGGKGLKVLYNKSATHRNSNRILVSCTPQIWEKAGAFIHS